MLRASPLCSSTSFSHYFPNISILNRCTRLFRRRLPLTCKGSASLILQLPLYHLHCFALSHPSRRRVATSEIFETVEAPSGFVEIGYISNVHGTDGEVRVKPTTDFPELRFSTPGTRWLKQKVSGREEIREVDLENGREHPGRKSWILKFIGVDTADQAKLLIGSTLLVNEEDRPELEEGEFYSRDLVGMSVIMKETGQSLGTVVNVYDFGAQDLLHVMLNCSEGILDTSGNPTSIETGLSGHLVWIPFVEAIVPIVDLQRREIKITPPKGLLELNFRSDKRSKKERRQLEWKERKKFQKHLVAAKKELSEMEQKHVFDGFKFGEKAQGKLLADQIVGINSKLLQKALQDIEIPTRRLAVNELFDASKLVKVQNTLGISDRCVISGANEEELGTHANLQKTGHDLISSGKTAVILVVNDEGWYSDLGIVCDTADHPASSSLPDLLSDDRRFAKIEDRPYVPLILVCSASTIHSIEKLFVDNDYFAFDSEKIWFLKEERLPVVSNVVDEKSKFKILMKSPWEILQSPVGSGGVINLLSSPNVLGRLAELGMEYVEICSSSHRNAGMNSLLLGCTHSCGANIGIQLHKGDADFEKSFDLIFSMNFIRRLMKQIDKPQFYAIPKPNAHVEKVEKEWVEVSPSSPNSYHLYSSIFSCLDECSFDEIFTMENS
ncbi:hypothetical protein IC582_029246 [Cucumis melo]|uniref:RimM domain-containing protein/PRC domain-containing protein n=1 Tax=Cucumis melo var. makuwa TaxID=1194695 RepID=A0A5A7UUB3_CUCMM|nr:RimM domain-containing protein/PRC domain-containing protein [Cucumis melo var. makuwa]TYK20626.1 RimM domain-containing protein/PRC domain-containing protein [Cucumis melo var. makuwa]